MGISALLFFNSNGEEPTLHRRCSPSDEQQLEQKERWHQLADYLRTNLRLQTGYAVRTYLQGSYKFGTQIRPVTKDDEFDIDLGVLFEWEGHHEEGRHSAQQLKQFVHDSLHRYHEAGEDSDTLEVDAPKANCSRIAYKKNFHIDVPAYHLSPQRDRRMLCSESGWSDSDPKKFYLWWKDYLDEEQRALARRQIRYLKAWAALNIEESSRPSSILLTVLVSEAISSMSISGEDDDDLSAIVNALVIRLEESNRVPNPVNKDEDLNRLSDQAFALFKQRLHWFKGLAQTACSTTHLFQACDQWQNAFLYLFPLPAIAEDLSSLNKLPMLANIPEISVKAVTRSSPRRTLTGRNSIGPIPKECDLIFEVSNASTFPLGAEINWMVRNHGAEAEEVNDLGHLNQTGPSAKEISLYSGTHYMDCIVRLHNQTIGMRRVPVSISKMPFPPRNPTQRPAYTRLRKPS